MRGDDDVGHGNEPHQLVILDNVAGEVLIEEVALLLVNVQTGRAHLLVLDAGDQVLGVHQSAPGGIDNGDTLLHLVDGSGINDMPGLLRQGAVQGDDVGLGKELGQVHIVQAAVRCGELIVGQNVHAEALADIGEDPADFAGADDANGLAVEIKACQALETKIEVPGADIGLVGAAVDGQQQGHGVLGNGIGGVGGHPVDGELAARCPDIHIVEAGAPQGDNLHAHFIELLHNGRIHGVVDEDAHGIKAGSQGDGVRIEPGFKILDFQIGSGSVVVEAGNVIGFCIKKSNFHKKYLHKVFIYRYNNSETSRKCQ